jgi:hypothetical protein
MTDTVESLRVEVEKLRAERVRIEEAAGWEVQGDTTHMTPWHSPECYRGGAHRDSKLCTCGLTRLYEEREKLKRAARAMAGWIVVRADADGSMLCRMCGKSDGHIAGCEVNEGNT